MLNEVFAKGGGQRQHHFHVALGLVGIIPPLWGLAKLPVVIDFSVTGEDLFAVFFNDGLLAGFEVDDGKAGEGALIALVGANVFVRAVWATVGHDLEHGAQVSLVQKGIMREKKASNSTHSGYSQYIFSITWPLIQRE